LVYSTAGFALGLGQHFARHGHHGGIGVVQGDDLHIVAQGQFRQVDLPAQACADEAQAHLGIAGHPEALHAAGQQGKAQDGHGGVADEGAAVVGDGIHGLLVGVPSVHGLRHCPKVRSFAGRPAGASG
jgi:hypothetical protein